MCFYIEDERPLRQGDRVVVRDSANVRVATVRTVYRTLFTEWLLLDDGSTVLTGQAERYDHWAGI